MISICVATYNGSKYISRQLESILCQLGEHDEIIISDDDSTDNTCEVIIMLDDNRIKIIKNKNSRGPLNNFQNALNHSSGDYIFLSDQDDIWFSNKIELMMDYLQHYDLVVSDCEVVDQNLTTLIPSFFNYRGSKPGLLRNLYKNSYIGCCMAFRRELLTHALPFPSPLHMHDWWIGLVAEVYGRVSFLPQPLIKYVRHDSNASPTGEGSDYSFIYQMQNRLLISWYLFKRWLR